MTGLIVLAITVPLVFGYFWLARFAVRYAKRKTQSNLVVALVIAGIIVITFGDTVFNRWYHKEVLCKREEVGVRIFEKTHLPAEYVDQKTSRPKFPLPLDQAFFTRFLLKETRTTSGYFPFTAHGRIERSVIDKESGKVLAQLVNYWPDGGPWWAIPPRWFSENSLIGWLYSRHRIPTCLDHANRHALLNIEEYFYELGRGD